MKCMICKQGNTVQGVTVVTLTRAESIVLLKNVPADICENCGEYYLSEDITEQVLLKGESALKKGVEIEVLSYVA
ncbi:type II toxin-antitoxin system MqsA family antitoxin [Deltaproteobacteria bacterium TL4]